MLWGFGWNHSSVPRSHWFPFGILKKLGHLILRRSHFKLARRDQDERHADGVGPFDRQAEVVGPLLLVPPGPASVERGFGWRGRTGGRPHPRPLSRGRERGGVVAAAVEHRHQQAEEDDAQGRAAADAQVPQQRPSVGRQQLVDQPLAGVLLRRDRGLGLFRDGCRPLLRARRAAGGELVEKRGQCAVAGCLRGQLLPRLVRLAACLQGLDHLAHRLVAVVGTLGQHFLEDGVHDRRHVGADLADRGDRLLDVGHHDLDRRLARVRGLSGQQTAERAAKRVDVGAVVGRVRVLGLLRGDVVDRAHDLAGRGEALGAVVAGDVFFEACQAHVEDLDAALPVQKQVARLDVAVDHAVLVGVPQTPGCLDRTLDGLIDRQRPAPLDDVGKVLPVDILHDQVVDAVALAGVVSGDDVGMVQSRGGLDLAIEPANRIGRLHSFAGQDLQGDDPLHAPVLCLEDLAHAAGPDPVQHHVLAHHQPLQLSLVDRFGLEASEPVGEDQLPGEVLGGLGLIVGREALLERGQLLGREETAADQAPGELLETDGHAATMRERSPIITSIGGRAKGPRRCRQ